MIAYDDRQFQPRGCRVPPLGGAFGSGSEWYSVMIPFDMSNDKRHLVVPPTGEMSTQLTLNGTNSTITPKVLYVKPFWLDDC